MKDYQKLTSPCGLDCFNCQLYENNLTEELQQTIAKQLGKNETEIKCKGCRAQNGCSIHENCATLTCITSKGHEYCYECEEFPCTKLQPCSDGAASYPHNYKIYNLCRIKSVGVEKWGETEAQNIRNKYFTGTFVVGKGPV